MRQTKSWVKDQNGQVWDAGDPSTKEFYTSIVMHHDFGDEFHKNLYLISNVIIAWSRGRSDVAYGSSGLYSASPSTQLTAMAVITDSGETITAQQLKYDWHEVHWDTFTDFYDMAQIELFVEEREHPDGGMGYYLVRGIGVKNTGDVVVSDEIKNEKTIMEKDGSTGWYYWPFHGVLNEEKAVGISVGRVGGTTNGTTDSFSDYPTCITYQYDNISYTVLRKDGSRVSYSSSGEAEAIDSGYALYYNEGYYTDQENILHATFSEEFTESLDYMPIMGRDMPLANSGMTQPPYAYSFLVVAKDQNNTFHVQLQGQGLYEGDYSWILPSYFSEIIEAVDGQKGIDLFGRADMQGSEPSHYGKINESGLLENVFESSSDSTNQVDYDSLNSELADGETYIYTAGDNDVYGVTSGGKIIKIMSKIAEQAMV